MLSPANQSFDFALHSLLQPLSLKSNSKLCYIQMTSLLVKVKEEIVVGCVQGTEAVQIPGLAEPGISSCLSPFSLLSNIHFHLLFLQLIALET